MHNTPADTSQAVDTFMALLEHPAKDAIELLRSAILASDPSITEGIKWKAPSFKVQEYFATINLRAKAGVGLVLHFGAKVRAFSAGKEAIQDPGAILKWLAKDRAMIEFKDAKDVKARTPALQAILRQWIVHV